MQRPDEKKRRDILKVAERLFATNPFHEVKLDDVAARAKIGKGTIYIYFNSKEELYVAVIRDGKIEMARRLREGLARAQKPALAQLELIIGEMVDFAAARPNMYQLMRSIAPRMCRNGQATARSELVELIRETITRGVKRRELDDPNPHLTAQVILSAVRGSMLFGAPETGPAAIKRHLTKMFSRALKRGVA